MKANILVIEDHPDVSNAMVLLLERAGCKAVAAETGVQGLALAKDRHFDVITLDIDLPGISGLEVCRFLKRDPALCHIPVIFISGRGCDENIRHGLALGAVDYITKPFEGLAFISRVLSHVGKKDRCEASMTLPG